MKTPRELGKKIYDEYREGGHSNPSSLEDLTFLNIPGAVFKSKLLQQQSTNSSTNSMFGSTTPNFGSSFGSSAFGSQQQKSNPFSSSTVSSPFGSRNNYNI